MPIQPTHQKAIHLAIRYLYMVNYSAGDTISNMKMQKLLYLTQLEAAKHSEPFFMNRIEAWAKGPCVPSVYFTLRKYGQNAIDITDFNPMKPYGNWRDEVMERVFNTYGHTPAQKLQDMVRKSAPYSTIYGDRPYGQQCLDEITFDLMQQYHAMKKKEHKPTILGEFPESTTFGDSIPCLIKEHFDPTSKEKYLHPYKICVEIVKKGRKNVIKAWEYNAYLIHYVGKVYSIDHTNKCAIEFMPYLRRWVIDSEQPIARIRRFLSALGKKSPDPQF